MRPWVRAGLVGAALSGAPSTAVLLARRGDLLASTEAVGTVLLGRRGTRLARLAVGGSAHVAISLTWARILARLLGRNTDAVRSVVDGTAAGLGIAALDLGLIGRHLPPIRRLPGGLLLADHLAYGAIVGWLLGREGGPPARTVAVGEGSAGGTADLL